MANKKARRKADLQATARELAVVAFIKASGAHFQASDSDGIEQAKALCRGMTLLCVGTIALLVPNLPTLLQFATFAALEVTMACAALGCIFAAIGWAKAELARQSLVLANHPDFARSRTIFDEYQLRFERLKARAEKMGLEIEDPMNWTIAERAGARRALDREFKPTSIDWEPLESMLKSLEAIKHDIEKCYRWLVAAAAVYLAGVLTLVLVIKPPGNAQSELILRSESPGWKTRSSEAQPRAATSDGAGHADR